MHACVCECVYCGFVYMYMYIHVCMLSPTFNFDNLRFVSVFAGGVDSVSDHVVQ